MILIFEIIKYVYLKPSRFQQNIFLKREREKIEYKVIHQSLFESLLTKRSLSLGSSPSETTGVIISLAPVQQLLTSVCVSHSWLSRVCIRCRSWRAAAISWRSWWNSWANWRRRTRVCATATTSSPYRWRTWAPASSTRG